MASGYTPAAQGAVVGTGVKRARRRRGPADRRILHDAESIMGPGEWRGQDVVVPTRGVNFLATMMRAYTAMRAMGMSAADEPPNLHPSSSGRRSGATSAGEIVHESMWTGGRAGAVGPSDALARAPDGGVRDNSVVWTWGFELLSEAFDSDVSFEASWARAVSSEHAHEEEYGGGGGGLVDRERVQVPMFEYQWRCVDFMLRRERDAAASRRTVPTTLSDGAMHLDLKAWALRRGPAPAGGDGMTLEMRGGCVFDDVGMGKTREVLVAALMDAGVTLVVCKPHLVEDWVSEATTLGLAAYSCVSVPQLRGLTLAVLRTVSVVVLSTSTLARYINDSCWARAPGAWPGVPLERVRFRRVVVDEAHTVLLNDARVMAVNAETRFLSDLCADFRWAVTGTPQRMSIRALTWFLGMRLGGPRAVDPLHGLPRYAPLDEAAKALMRASTIRRTARALRAERARLPELQISTLVVDMTAEETRLVNSMTSTDGIRRALCHPQAAHEGGGHDLARVMTIKELTAERLESAEQDLAAARRRLERKEVELKRATDRRAEAAERHVDSSDGEAERADLVAQMSREIESKSGALADLARRCDRLRGNVAFLRNQTDGTGAGSSCPICLDSISGVHAVANCGHYTCGSCMDALLRVARTCPVCRDPIHKGGVTRISPPKEPRAAGDGMAEMRAKYGSKTAAVTLWLKDTLSRHPDARIIVYCMYDRYLRIMERVFRENGIVTRWIMGGAARSGDTVRAFQAGTVPVLLASLERAAEGLNLTRGTHVLFVHSMDRTQHTLIRQAGGRINRLGQTAARVHYVYAYARNTIEQVLVDRYPDELKPTAVPATAPPPVPS